MAKPTIAALQAEVRVLRSQAELSTRLLQEANERYGGARVNIEQLGQDLRIARGSLERTEKDLETAKAELQTTKGRLEEQRSVNQKMIEAAFDRG